MQHWHVELDRATWDAYGWSEDKVPAEGEEDVIFSWHSWLRDMNGGRAGAA
jgi:hypothetical protein